MAQLDDLKAIKEDIRQAINEKNVPLDTTVPFEDYSDAINSITTGSSENTYPLLLTDDVFECDLESDVLNTNYTTIYVVDDILNKPSTWDASKTFTSLADAYNDSATTSTGTNIFILRGEYNIDAVISLSKSKVDIYGGFDKSGLWEKRDPLKNKTIFLHNNMENPYVLSIQNNYHHINGITFYSDSYDVDRFFITGITAGISVYDQSLIKNCMFMGLSRAFDIDAGGGISINDIAEINNCYFTSTSVIHGTGIRLVIKNCVFHKMTEEIFVRGIYKIDNCKFIGCVNTRLLYSNETKIISNVYAYGCDSGLSLLFNLRRSLTITNVKIHNCSFYNNEFLAPTVKDIEIINCSTTTDSIRSALYFSNNIAGSINGTTLDISNIKIINSGPFFRIIKLEYDSNFHSSQPITSIKIQNVVIQNCSAEEGINLYSDSNNVSISNFTCTDNSIYNSAEVAFLKINSVNCYNCALLNNKLFKSTLSDVSEPVTLVSFSLNNSNYSSVGNINFYNNMSDTDFIIDSATAATIDVVDWSTTQDMFPEQQTPLSPFLLNQHVSIFTDPDTNITIQTDYLNNILQNTRDIKIKNITNPLYKNGYDDPTGTVVPTEDITGLTRPTPPSIGAYDYVL